LVRRQAGRILIAAACAAALLGLGGSASAEHGDPGSTVLVSRPTGLGAPAVPTTNNSFGVDPPTYSQASRRTISNDGQYVVFSSDADGLSPDDNNKYRNVFVRDTVNHTTTLVSRANGVNGAAANGNSYTPTISADGTQVAFITDATNLDPNVTDNNNDRDVYVRDLVNDTTSAVNTSTGGYGNIGSESPSVAVAGGKVLVAFATYATNIAGVAKPFQEDVYLRNVTDGTTTVVSRPNLSTSTFGDAGSFEPDISADGSTVAFTSDATNLVTGDTNAKRDVFVRQLASPYATALVSRATGGSGAIGNDRSGEPSINSDGTKVAFVTYASNFDAAHIGGTPDAYVRDLTNSTTTLVNRSDGVAGTIAPYVYQPSISGDGSKVAWISPSAELESGVSGPFAQYQVYVRTLATGATKLASRVDGQNGERADDGSSSPSVTVTSGGHTLVAFASKADNLSTEADNDFSNVFVRDMTGGQTTYVSRPSGTAAFTGTGVNTSIPVPQNSVSADGRYVLFSSQADNLSTLDNNRYQNVFVRDTLTDQTLLVSRADDGSAVDGDSWAGGISADGSTVSFASDGDNLVSGLLGYPEEYYVRTLHSDHSLDHTIPVTGTTDANEGQQYPGTEGTSLPSGDGTKVAFQTQFNYDGAADTVQFSRDIYVKDLNANTYTLVDRAGATLGSGFSTKLKAFSRDGTKVVFETDVALDPTYDTNSTTDVYMRDLAAGTTTLVSRANGPTGATGTYGSYGGGISDDGDRIAFSSNNGDLVSGVSAGGQTYVRDISNNQTILVSTTSGGVVADDYSRPGASISGDGKKVVFSSPATNLAPGAVGGIAEAYTKNLTTGTTTLVSKQAGSLIPADQPAVSPNISQNGDCVVFGSNADNLIAGFGAGIDFGNVYMSTISRECPVDLPTTTINSGPSGTVKDKVGTFGFTADETGSTFECKVDSGAFAACTSPFSTAALADGAHSFAVRATDAAGYQEASPVTRSWSVDSTPPDTTITGGPPAATSAGSASFTFSSTENSSTFVCSIDGGAFAACSPPKLYTGLTDGTHTFAVRATDAVGNDDPSPATRSWMVDTTPPKAKITSSPLGAVASKHATFTFTATEAATFACSLDGATPTPCSSPASYDGLADGKHTFGVQATDAVGNHGLPAGETWTIDTTAPTATLGISKQKLRTVLKRGLKVRVGSSEGAIFTITLRKGKKKVGENIGSLGGAGSKLVPVRLFPKVRKALRRARSLTLTVTLVERDTLGNASRRVTRTVKLGR
jgi:hypothetical protein